MTIAIDGSRAFLRQRTGIEEYSYQVILHLRNILREESVILYIRADQDIDFDIPQAWRVKKLWAPRLWTQIRLSFEMLVTRPDVLFVPAHTVPIIHPSRTVVVVHGLEYEVCPQAYSWFARWYMRYSIRFSCRVASKIICVTNNTLHDVQKWYHAKKEKMVLVYEGYEKNHERQINRLSHSANGENIQPYMLYIGRLEERKNIVRTIEAYEYARDHKQVSYQLVLAGRPGYKYDVIAEKIAHSRYKDDIVLRGFVSEKEKWELLAGASIFLFATLYEGFGIPVLEAQSMGIPVITSNVSSLPEVAGDGAILVDPLKSQIIAEAILQLLSENDVRDAIIQNGYKNIQRFSWNNCAQEIGKILKER